MVVAIVFLWVALKIQIAKECAEIFFDRFYTDTIKRRYQNLDIFRCSCHCDIDESVELIQIDILVACQSKEVDIDSFIGASLQLVDR
jgi:hypothetical protein